MLNHIAVPAQQVTPSILATDGWYWSSFLIRALSDLCLHISHPTQLLTWLMTVEGHHHLFLAYLGLTVCQ